MNTGSQRYLPILCFNETKTKETGVNKEMVASSAQKEKILRNLQIFEY